MLQQWLTSQNLAGEAFYADSAVGGRLDWAAIAGASPGMELVEEIREEGRRLAERPIPVLTQELYDLFETTGNRLAYEGLYFERRRMLTTFALLHLTEPDNATILPQLCGVIEAILEEKTWCLPAHMRGQQIDRHIDLFAAETGFTLSEIVTLAGERLPRPLTEAMLAQIDRRLFVPYLTCGPYHWETAEHNWAAVCAGSIASAALLVEPDAERRAGICAKAIATMNHYLAGFGGDGACLEGPGYWNYGFGYYVFFADLLKRATGGQADLLADDKVERIAQFQQKGYLIGNRPANFSDAMPYVSVHIGLSDYLAARYESVENPPLRIRDAYGDDHCSRFAPALRNLIWLCAEAPRAEDWQPGSWYLPDAQWMISRTVSSAGSFGFAAKGGMNDEPHNHIDVGHFILLAGDDPAFAADLGSGEYTADYFGAGRYRYDCTGAQGHSLPVIDGQEQLPGAERAAIVLGAETGEAKDILSLELAGTYEAEGISSFTRTFAWHKAALPALTVRDRFRFNGQPKTVTEVIVTRCKPELEADGKIVLQGDRHQAVLTYEAGHFAASVEERAFSNHFGQEERYYRILLTTDRGLDGELEATLQFNFK